jgi:hypothetical protein
MPAEYDLDEHGRFRPDAEDFEAVTGTPDDPRQSQVANDGYKYRLAASHKLIRLLRLRTASS